MQQGSSVFPGDDHLSFDFAATPSKEGSRRVGALLLHGFMGTPRELRPLGRALAADGVRAVAPLLPGFGPQIADLARTTAADWMTAVNTAWTTLRAESDRTVLVGFSFGAALALQAAANAEPNALILISPYVRLIDLPSWVLVAGLPVLKRTIKRFSPYASADFMDPEVRRFFQQMDPALDLDDIATQNLLRQSSTIPFSVIDQMRQATDRGRKAASTVTAPTLMIQGTRDDTSTVARTRALAGSLRGPLTLRELDADHLIVDDQKPSWPTTRDSVLTFAREQLDPRQVDQEADVTPVSSS